MHVYCLNFNKVSVLVVIFKQHTDIGRKWREVINPLLVQLHLLLGSTLDRHITSHTV